MQMDLMLVWFLIFVLFLVMSVIERKAPVFGMCAGIWLIWIGVYIFLSGIQYQSGMSISTVDGVQTVVYQYADFVSPFSDYKTLWSIPFWGIGIYICFASVWSYRNRNTK
jgi:uncharacterized protein YqgC (DUF456 family)